MSLINCEINLIRTWSKDCVFSATGKTKFEITDTKLYAPVVTLSTRDNAKLLQQSKLGYKWLINWDKYQPKVLLDRLNQYIDFLINPSFQEVHWLFVLSYENEDDRKVNPRYYLSKVKIKNYNFMIDAKKLFWSRS